MRFCVLFACCHWAHFSFLFSRRIFLFFFLLLLAHFLISHGSLANLVKTATENLIKPGISFINISASACLAAAATSSWSAGHIRADVILWLTRCRSGTVRSPAAAAAATAVNEYKYVYIEKKSNVYKYAYIYTSLESQPNWNLPISGRIKAAHNKIM